MASHVTTAPAASAAPKVNTFETTAWRYMRWSGVLIVPLAFIHLAIMHIINSVYEIDYHWVVELRWAHLGWRIYDAFLLWFAGLHGFNGLRVVINDYVHQPALNRALKIAALVVLVFVFFVGTVALIGTPFQPDPSVPREEGFRLLTLLLS
jgi:succinate dehydrogenase / fumarate reductase membrane anchor subunit